MNLSATSRFALLPRVLCISAFALAASLSARADTLADWTFETSVPVTAGPVAPELTGPGITGTASGFHSGSTTYSSPAGNGSTHSYSSTDWLSGDYYQFELNTTGYQNVMMAWDQISSSTGPGSFGLFYSTDGSSFTQFGSNFTILANSGATVWSSATHITASSYSFDLSSIAALDNAPQVYFRVEDMGGAAANGGTVGTGGTDRVDNVAVTATPVAVPEPSTVGIVAFGAASLVVLLRKRALLG